RTLTGGLGGRTLGDEPVCGLAHLVNGGLSTTAERACRAVDDYARELVSDPARDTRAAKHGGDARHLFARLDEVARRVHVDRAAVIVVGRAVVGVATRDPAELRVLPDEEAH